MDLQPLGRISDYDGFPTDDGQHVLTWRGFGSNQAEDVYRRNRLDRDRLQGTLFVVAHAALTLTCTVTDWYVLTATPFYVHLALRVLVVVLAGLGLWRLWRARSPLHFDRTLAALVVVLVGSTLFLLTTKPASLETASIVVASIGVVAFTLPAEWYIRGLAGGVLMLGYLLQAVTTAPPDVWAVVLLATATLNIVGVFSAYEASRWRRRDFITLVNEVRRRTELEGQLAKVKNLQTILPICAHCRRVRDASDQWQMLDRYLRDHAGVRFSHGICKECLLIHHPKQFETR